MYTVAELTKISSDVSTSPVNKYYHAILAAAHQGKYYKIFAPVYDKEVEILDEVKALFPGVKATYHVYGSYTFDWSKEVAASMYRSQISE